MRLAVGTVGARMLARLGWTARAPLLAVLVYLAAAWSVVAAFGLAGLTLAVNATALGSALSQLIGACVLRLRATYATPGGVAMARTARMVGRPEPALGAVLVERSQPAAYCVAGRQARDPGSLATALVVLAAAASAPAPTAADTAGPAAVLAAAAGPAPVLAAAAGPAPVSAAGTSSASVLPDTHGSVPVLASAATDTVQRIHRLLRPAEPLGKSRQFLLRATVAALVLGPLVMALAPAVLALALGRVPHA